MREGRGNKKEESRRWEGVDAWKGMDKWEGWIKELKLNNNTWKRC